METIPSSSLAIPILGQYLVFTLIMITLSILSTIVVLNIHFRSPSSHQMKPWVRRLFIRTLPKILLMRSPQYKLEASDSIADNGNKNGKEVIENGGNGRNGQGRRYTASDIMNPPTTTSVGDAEELIQELDSSPDGSDPLGFEAISGYPSEIDKATKAAMFIAQHIDNKDEYQSVSSIRSSYSAIRFPVFDTLITFRSTRTGSTLRWFWTDCSCGSSQLHQS